MSERKNKKNKAGSTVKNFILKYKFVIAFCFPLVVILIISLAFRRDIMPELLIALVAGALAYYGAAIFSMFAYWQNERLNQLNKKAQDTNERLLKIQEMPYLSFVDVRHITMPDEITSKLLPPTSTIGVCVFEAQATDAFTQHLYITAELSNVSKIPITSFEFVVGKKTDNYGIEFYNGICHIAVDKLCAAAIKLPMTKGFLSQYENGDEIQLHLYFINAMGYKTEGMLIIKKGEEPTYKVKQFIDIKGV